MLQFRCGGTEARHKQTKRLGKRLRMSHPRPSLVHQRVPVQLRVNGHRHEVSVEERQSLLDVTSSPWVDGSQAGMRDGPVWRLYGAGSMARPSTVVCCWRSSVRDAPSPLSKGWHATVSSTRYNSAFVDHDALQCGFCTPGQVLAMKALLAAHSAPNRRRDFARYVWQPVPLWRVRQDSAAGRRSRDLAGR